MARAAATLGLDNGLLHLAACGPAPVVFGLTTADPRHRTPPRSEGERTIVLTPPESLTCRFCQSRMRFLVGHNFDRCIYEDYACTKTLTGELYLRALDVVLRP
jgi:ADP-heptose:LPS heptosyltransferase